MTPQIPGNADEWNARGAGSFFGHVGLEIVSVDAAEIRARLPVLPHHLAPNGFLHAGAVVTLADSACGVGTVTNLPEGAIGFTTIELKANFLGTALEGALECVARLVHGGRSTQVWDALVTAQDSGKRVAMFRCTQMVLYPREG